MQFLAVLAKCFIPAKLKIMSFVLGLKAAFTRSVWNRYEIGTDKPCVYAGTDGSGTDWICYTLPNGSAYMKAIPYRIVPFQFRTGPV